MTKNWKYFITFFGLALVIFMKNIVYAEAEMTKIEGVYKYQFKNGTVHDGSYMSEDILEIVPVSKDTIYFKEKLECFNGCRCQVYGLAKYTKENLFLFSDKNSNSERIMHIFSLINPSFNPSAYPLNSIFILRKNGNIDIAFMKNGQWVEKNLDEKKDVDIIRMLPKEGWSTKDPDLVQKLQSKFDIPLKEKEPLCFLKIIPDRQGIRIVSSGDCKEYCGVRGILDNDRFTYDKRRKIRYMTVLKNSKEYQSSIEYLRE